MRSLLAIAGILVSGPVVADTFTIDTDVKSVTLYNNGGSILREGAVNIPAGRHDIILRDTGNVDLALSEFSFTNSEGLRVDAIQYRTDGLSPYIVEKSETYLAREADVIAAEKALADYDLAIAKDRGVAESAKTRLQFLQSIAAGVVGALPKDAGVSAAEIDGVTQSLGAQIEQATLDLTGANQRIQGAERMRVKLIEKRDFAQQALDAVTPAPRSETEIILQVTSATPYSGTLELTHLNGNMMWQPVYELRLDQDGKTGELKIDRFATVEQETGEDWENVNLVLSTAAVGRGLETYRPNPEILRLLDPQIRAKTKSLSRSMAQMDVANVAEESLQAGTIAEAPSQSIKGQTIEFVIKNPVNIASNIGNSSPTLLKIDTLNKSVDVFAQANAARDDKAYLYTDLENTTGGNLLEGRATVYRDGAFMGDLYFPSITNGDTEEVALGPLDGLLIDRFIISREDGDRGIITSSNSRKIRNETVITSLLDYAIDLRLFDNIPVSEDEDLVIKPVLKPNPSEQNIDGARGILRWDIDVSAGAKHTVETGYNMTWPAEKEIIGGYR